MLYIKFQSSSESFSFSSKNATHIELPNLWMPFYNKVHLYYMHFCNFAADFNLLLIPSSIQAQFFFFFLAILPSPQNRGRFI